MESRAGVSIRDVWPEYYYHCRRLDELDAALKAHEERYTEVQGVRYDREPVSGSRRQTDRGLVYTVLKDEMENEVRQENKRRMELRPVMEQCLQNEARFKNKTKQAVCRMYFVEQMSLHEIAQAVDRGYRTVDSILHACEETLGIDRYPVYSGAAENAD